MILFMLVQRVRSHMENFCWCKMLHTYLFSHEKDCIMLIFYAGSLHQAEYNLEMITTLFSPSASNAAYNKTLIGPFGMGDCCVRLNCLLE